MVRTINNTFVIFPVFKRSDKESKRKIILASENRRTGGGGHKFNPLSKLNLLEQILNRVFPGRENKRLMANTAKALNMIHSPYGIYFNPNSLKRTLGQSWNIYKKTSKQKLASAERTGGRQTKKSLWRRIHISDHPLVLVFLKGMGYLPNPKSTAATKSAKPPANTTKREGRSGNNATVPSYSDPYSDLLNPLNPLYPLNRHISSDSHGDTHRTHHHHHNTTTESTTHHSHKTDTHHDTGSTTTTDTSSSGGDSGY